MRVLKLILVLAFVVLFLQPDQSMAQLKEKVLGYRIEDVKVGDQFVYYVSETRPGRRKNITTRSTLIERVADINADYEFKTGARKLIRDTTTGLSVYYLQNPGVNFSINEPRALTPLRSAGQWKTYPLVFAKGKSVKLPETEQVIDLGSSKSSTKTTTSIALLGKERMKVGKQTYSCVKLRETISSESRSIPVPDSNGVTKKAKPVTPKIETRVATMWYSPELGTLVKYYTTVKGQSFTQTLTRYIKSPTETALLEKK
jgi:hypothetical protein